MGTMWKTLVQIDAMQDSYSNSSLHNILLTFYWFVVMEETISMLWFCDQIKLVCATCIPK